MPNESGTNQFNRFQQSPAYGDVKRLTQLTRAAPMSGAPVAAGPMNAPRRLQRQTVRGQPAQAEPFQMPPAFLAVAPPEVPQPSLTRQVWPELAAHHEASPLVREYASRA